MRSKYLVFWIKQNGIVTMVRAKPKLNQYGFYLDNEFIYTDQGKFPREIVLEYKFNGVEEVWADE